MLDIKGICKVLPDGRQLLKSVGFSIDKGEFVGILGPSGAGKSLTIRCALGLTHPETGTVHLTAPDGTVHNLTNAKARKLRTIRQHIGVVFQGFHLVKRLTVLQNVMIGRLGRINPLRSWLYGFTDKEAEEAMAALEHVGMKGFAHRVTESLSGGEMQRVAIARALHQDPYIIIADEPIASLDPKNASAIMKLLKPISKTIPILAVLHQPEIASKYCSRIIGIKDGSIIYDGSPSISKDLLKDLYGDELDQIVHQPTPSPVPVHEPVTLMMEN